MIVSFIKAAMTMYVSYENRFHFNKPSTCFIPRELQRYPQSFANATQKKCRCCKHCIYAKQSKISFLD